jgi:hypothetical protein
MGNLAKALSAKKVKIASMCTARQYFCGNLSNSVEREGELIHQEIIWKMLFSSKNLPLRGCDRLLILRVPIESI